MRRIRNREMNKMLDDAEVSAFRNLLDKSKRVVLTCHVRPDGDAIGSTLGLACLLRSIGKDTSVVVPDMPPKTLSYLAGFQDILVYTRYDHCCERMVKDADLIICCDFNRPERQDHLAPLIQEASCPKALVDHHLDPGDFAQVCISYPEMSSTCELVVRLIAALGLWNHVDKECATDLLTGIVTDTRNFTVNCKHPDLYEILSRLMEKGADKERIVKLSMMTRSYASLKLQAYAISEKMEVFDRHHGSIICISSEELERFHYERGDTEGLVNMPLEVKGIVWSFFLREDSDCIKVSSRSVMGFPVNKICEDLFGGGGHLQASGAEFHGTLAECRKKLIDAMSRYDQYLPAKVDKIDRYDK